MARAPLTRARSRLAYAERRLAEAQADVDRRRADVAELEGMNDVQRRRWQEDYDERSRQGRQEDDNR